MRILILVLATALSAAAPAAPSQQGGATTPAASQPEGAATLENTYWRLKKLGDVEPAFARNAREPHLTFFAGGTVSGADGCNTLRGTYRLDGDALSIGPVMGTLMACPGLDRLDRRFLDALGLTKKWKASATELTLVDGKDQPLATFEAGRP
jgi:heat shock protein HslJ